MRQCQNTFLSFLSTVTFSSLGIFTVALLKSLLSLVPGFSQVQFVLFFFFVIVVFLPAFFPCRGHTFLLLYVFHLFLKLNIFYNTVVILGTDYPFSWGFLLRLFICLVTLLYYFSEDCLFHSG